ncbi:MAG: hypothetical protein DRJ02_02335 [Bacteroidetes bacterium]|nr:MAG: hypothetical protein DRJ02_02335 [Bacteroidota bacterium]
MKTKKIDGIACFFIELMVARSPLSDHMNCLVLESDPMPDYYAKNNFPPNEKQVSDRHLFLPVRKTINCFQDVVFRKVNELNKKFNSHLSIYPGQITFQNEEHQCIRLNLKETDQLPQLIEEFEKLNIRFYSDKKVGAYQSLIYYKKHTVFENLEEGVYKDENNPNRYFFEISRQIEFDQFKKGIERIKNNCDYHLFDSFLVSLHFKNEINDFIGIYSKHCEKSRFKELKQEIIKQFN